MVKEFRFYLACLRRAWLDSIEQANTLAALLGGLILFVVLQRTEALKEIAEMDAPTSVAGTLAFALVVAVLSVFLAWAIIFAMRLVTAPAELYWGLREGLHQAKAEIERLKTVPESDYIPLADATVRTYDELAGSGWRTTIDSGTEHPEERMARMTSILINNVAIYGMERPSRELRRVREDELVGGHFVGEGNGYRLPRKGYDKFVGLCVRRADLEEAIRRMNM
jgi:hypothetical protein